MFFICSEGLLFHMEYLDVVNEENEIIEKKTRTEVHEKRLPHRTVMFFVFDTEGNILVTKRSDTKDFFPGYWSVVMGGHVTSGDGYDETLEKEMKEEIGTLGKYTEIGEFIKDIPEEVEYVRLYKVTVSPEDITLLKDEFEKGEFWTREKIEKEREKREFLPETDVVLGFLPY